MCSSPKTLHLTLQERWFTMIATGLKREEYRADKPHWQSRLVASRDNGQITFKEYDQIKFKNGYGRNAPTVVADCRGIIKGLGNPAWGAPEQDEVFIILIGEILTRKFKA